MSVHDWTRVEDGVFHSFHTTWIGELTKALNAGLLPSDHYALGEQVASDIGPDVLTLRAPAPEENGGTHMLPGAVAVATAPPKVQFTVRAEEEAYVRLQRTLVIRHVSGHRIVAMLEIVSAGNKSHAHALQSFLNKSLAALDQGIHVLIIDLYPPGTQDPGGMHGALWQQLTGDAYESPRDKRLTLAAYSAGLVKTAYVEPIAVGNSLPEMPLFLTPEEYVNVPLAATYDAAYVGVPGIYRRVLEA